MELVRHLGKSFALLFVVLVLSGCLKVLDHVQLHSDFRVEWSLRILGDLRGSESFFPTGKTKALSDSLQEFLYTRTFNNAAEVDSLDASAELGIVRQNMSWSRDSLGQIHWSRTLRVQRDMPGDDGAFADRMMGSIYRGYSCTFDAEFPGKILSVEPKPLKVDSAKGLVQWDIPLVNMVNTKLDMKVLVEPVSVNEESGKSYRFLVLAIAVGLFVLAFPLAWMWRRK